MLSNGFLDLTKFEKKKKIGKGSFGKVYIVEEKSTKQIYAAKVALKKISKNSPKDMLNISREVNIIAKLQHPSILQFIGYSQVDFDNKCKPVIITEYSSNGSLGDILELERTSQKIKGWDATKKLICIYGIAKGMEYLHSNNIIHRDLKPDNIFLDDYLCPKIADFGLSKINNDPSISISNLKTTTGTIKGTPIYIAPEIWSTQEYTESSDVYAYSLIMYEILTNEQPFKGYTMIQILLEIARNGNRPQIKNEIPECYQNLIKSCWSQSSHDRPSFHSIVEQIKNDPNFITKDIRKDDFYSYIEFLEKSQSMFDSTKKIIHLSDFVNSKSKTYQKVKIKKNKTKKDDSSNQLKIIEEEKETEIEKNSKIIDPTIFNKLDYSCRKLIIEAEDNNSDSLFIVSKSFIEGINNFPKDIEIGIKYIEYGVSLNNVEILEFYGKLLFEGDIIPKNEEKSIEILTKAANEFNSSNAKYELANIILSHQSYDVNDNNDDIDYVLAKKYSKEAADGGNTKAMILYSLLSLKEKKNKKGELHRNDEEHYKYLKMASDNEDPEGMALYGRLIELGCLDMKPNPNEAIKLYQKSFEKNDMCGCAFLGVFLFNGCGKLNKNEEDGSKLINLSAENNNYFGLGFKAVFLINDDKLKFETYKKIADRGYNIGYYLVGNCYSNGQGVDKNLKMAAKYYKRAHEEGNLGSSFFYGCIYYIDQLEFGIKANINRFIKYIKFSADHGYEDAMNLYAVFLSDTGKSPEKIKKYFKMGIKKGDIKCMKNYGCHLYEGKGVPQNFEKAAKYFKMGADLGDKECMVLYGNMLAEGKGVEKNEEEAQRYRLLGSNNENCLIQ